MLRSFINFLNEPFPGKDSYANMFSQATIAGIIIFLVLALLQPFGIANSHEPIWWSALQFGLITFFVIIIFEFLFYKVLNINKSGKSYTLFKWLAHTLLLVVCIALANALYATVRYDVSFNLPFVFRMLYQTLSIGLIPLFLIGSITLISALRKNQRLATSINEQIQNVDGVKPELFTISDWNLNIDFDDLLYIKAMENYVQIVFNQKEEVCKEMIRSTLKSIINSSPQQDLIQCHRSYLVNLSNVVSFSGNAQGLTLYMNTENKDEIPVSRKYIPLLREKLSS